MGKSSKVRTASEIRENVVDTFAYHCAAIMTETNLHGFGLSCTGGPFVEVEMRIASRSAQGAVWDQIEVNGVIVGNRCAARSEYARLCAPVLAAAFAAEALESK